MTGGRWYKEQIERLAIKRAKHKIKKDEARQRAELRNELRMPEARVERVCDNCGVVSVDAARYRVELTELRSVFAGYPVWEVCLQCRTTLLEDGANLVSVPEVTAENTNPNRRIYDNKPRIKMF